MLRSGVAAARRKRIQKAYKLGSSVEEISLMEGVSVRTVKKHIKRIRTYKLPEKIRIAKNSYKFMNKEETDKAIQNVLTDNKTPFAEQGWQEWAYRYFRKAFLVREPDKINYETTLLRQSVYKYANPLMARLRALKISRYEIKDTFSYIIDVLRKENSRYLPNQWNRSPAPEHNESKEQSVEFVQKKV